MSKFYFKAIYFECKRVSTLYLKLYAMFIVTAISIHEMMLKLRFQIPKTE